MKSILGFALIGVFLFSVFVSYFSNYQHYEATPGIIGFLSVFILWIWMVIDFFNRKVLPRKMRWGIALLIFNWIASIVYFVTVFHRSQDKIEFFEKIKLNNPKFYRYSLLVILAFIITISHFFFFALIYQSFAIPSTKLYTVIVNGIIYAPMSFFLETVYKLASVDFVSPPKGVAIFTHIVCFIYTFFLYFFLIMTFSHFRKIRVQHKGSVIA